jgi:hypothetical protein
VSIDNIVEAMGAETKGRFESIRNQYYNPNVKGGCYEKVVRGFLETYLGGRFSFHERCSLLDTQLRISEVFSDAENEWDVVGTYKNTIPSMVLEREGAPIISYDAVAFIVAVKQTLTQNHLEKDLDRFHRLSFIEYEKPSTSIGGNATVDHPLRVLFYYEGTVTQEQLMELVIQHSSWDVAISFKGESFIANSELFLTKHLTGSSNKPLFKPSSPHVLPWLILYLTACTPQPLRRDTSGLLFNLLKRDLDSLKATHDPSKNSLK